MAEAAVAQGPVRLHVDQAAVGALRAVILRAVPVAPDTAHAVAQLVVARANLAARSAAGETVLAREVVAFFDGLEAAVAQAVASLRDAPWPVTRP